ncbi:hypothetical protein ZJSPA_2876 [Salmonella enterica subsp. enterica serovar Paratyphi A str. ZJ98-53]|nr:hypothetical protein ZJSPA_2876 [Salmonella enterica subsp. enterica serovar Paratyphi A str. ZJ98-53]
MEPGLGEVLWANGLLKLFFTVYKAHHKTNPYRIIYVICLVWVRFLLLSDNCWVSFFLIGYQQGRLSKFDIQQESV